MPKEYDKIMTVLKKKFPGKEASERPTAWECVLFTALTARSRDDQVEPVFQELMRRYPTVDSLAKAKRNDVERVISTIGLYRAKAKAVIGMAKMVKEKFGGNVPKTIEQLTELPGVGRKTASCVMVYSYGIPAIAVDTHVHRVVNRIGWAKTATPAQTEMVLRETLPEKHWLDINRVMVSFGREICIPGRPRCYMCPIVQWCAYKNKNL